LEQAIEKAGTLNREKLRDVIATEEFMTVDGPVKFAGERTNTLARHGMCQWQNGVIEVVWPSDVATAPLEIPKPSWP
jgi:branched-chain amino acid transport system substrate-binding protein